MTVKFKFLEERPLQTTEELSDSKFGHAEIASTLIKIVKNSPAPFTIGLFAKWGSGKSTVANALKSELPKENIPVVLFDVWKHEGDALRRTFLKEAVAQLKNAGPDYFDKDFCLDDRITQSVSRNTESKIKFRSHLFRQFWPPVALGIIVAIVGAVVADTYGKFDLYLNFLFSVFGVTTGGGLLVWLVKNSVNLFTKETVTHAVDKFQDPHEFEEEFASILNALKHDRVLIIFDNLDRVLHTKVAEVLSTIKTFLEPLDLANQSKEVIFLVPCDANAIKKHLSSLYNKNDETGEGVFDPDEFLRKFFNTIIWIPDFILGELTVFARDCLKKTKVAFLDDDYVAWIITKAFRNNPRQIIQFVNILLANYLLIEERQGEDKDFPVDFLEENTPQLTKYLILNQLFPEEMDLLREQKAISLKETRLRENTSKEFTKFLNETDNIQINDLRVFFTLRRSEQEKQLPGFDAFIASLQDGSREDATTQITQFGDFKETTLIDAFSQAMKDEIQRTTNPVSRVNLISTLLSVLKSTSINLNGTLYEEINNVLKGPAKESIHTINPNTLNTVFLSKKAGYRPAIVEQWIAILQDFGTAGNKYKVTHEFVVEIFKIFTSQISYLYGESLNKLQKVLSENFSTDLTIAEMVTEPGDVQKKFVSKEYVQNFIAGVPNTLNMVDMERSLKVINDFGDDLLKSHGGEKIVKKFVDLMTVLNQDTKPESYPEKSKILDQFKKFISVHLPIFQTATIEIRDAFADLLVTGFNAPSDHTLRAAFLPVLYEVLGVISDAKKQEIERHISTWVANTEEQNFADGIKTLADKEKTAFFDSGVIFKAASVRAISQPKFRNLLFKELSDQKKSEFINRFLNTDVDNALAYLESMDGSELNFSRLSITNLWEKFNQGNPDQKTRILALVDKFTSEDDVEINDQWLAKVSLCLTDPDTNVQNVGRSAFNNVKLDKASSRKMVQDIISWLQTSGVAVEHQKNAVQTLMDLDKNMTDQEKSDLVSYLLGKVILQTNDQNLITDSFKKVIELGSKYEDQVENYDALKNRLETGGVSTEVEQAIVQGLAMNRPKRLNKNNSEFWEWVEAKNKRD